MKGKTLGRRRPFREKVPLSPNPTLLQKLSERKRADRDTARSALFSVETPSAFDGVWFFPACVFGESFDQTFSKVCAGGGRGALLALRRARNFLIRRSLLITFLLRLLLAREKWATSFAFFTASGWKKFSPAFFKRRHESSAVERWSRSAEREISLGVSFFQTFALSSCKATPCKP